MGIKLEDHKMYVDSAKMNMVPYSVAIRALEEATNTSTEKYLLELETAMNEDGLIGDDSVDNSELISNLKTLIKPNLEVDLTTHEDDIRQVLGKEFVFHVENTSGVFKFELPKDQVALEAISTLESGNYLQILAGNTND